MPQKGFNYHMKNSTSPNKARLLLERLKSPFLYVASEITPKTQTPQTHRHTSPLVKVMKQTAEAIESLSSGRFSLAKEQPSFDELPGRYVPLKMVCHVCQNYSWVTIGQLSAYENNPAKCCCYCEEPLTMDHIGPTLSDVQNFVAVRSGGKVRFSNSNSILGTDLSDIFAFNCLKPCRGLLFDSPMRWFLEESKPLKSFSEFKGEMTCGCPACTDRHIMKIANTGK
jgi:hypothetical protein